MNMRIAILDIGSNSVRFAAMERGCDGVFYVPDGRKDICTTRLGRGLDKTGLMSPEAMEATVSACRRFCDLASHSGIRVFAYATSAVRDASNRQELLDALKYTCPELDIFLLTGEEEGRLAYHGAIGRKAGTLLDIGGGSAQVVTPGWSVSFPTGCVRALDICPDITLPMMRSIIYSWLDSRISLPGSAEPPFYGVGGTITTLGALLQNQSHYDGSRISALALMPDTLDSLLERLSALGDTKRSKIPLLARRHDVILQGGLILRWFMENLHIEALTPTDRGGMEGFADWLAEKGVIE